jgi:hypothetical protein
MIVLPTLWWGSIVAGAAALAIRRPLAAMRLANGVLTVVVVGWVFLCGLGIAAQLQRGPGMDGLARETVFDAPHRLLSHIAVVLVAVAFCVSVPLAIERAAHRDGVGRLVLHLTLATATAMLVFLSAFTGYLGHPPVTEGSYFRFRVLHTMVVPFTTTLPLLGWLLLARRYRPASKPGATAG